MTDATAGWLFDLQTVWEDGLAVTPRGKPTREVVGYSSVPVNMRFPFLTTPERKLGYRFMAAEAAWILSGDDRVETIRPYSKAIANFSDDGVVFAGAYGPKVVGQLDYVVDCLASDRDSRQAVLTIWRESPGPSRDVPCTVSVQLLVRDGLLHCVDTMRSSDLWLGHPYDVANFSMLSAMVALKLRDRGVVVDLGYLHLTCGSKHVYESDREGIEAVLAAGYGNRSAPIFSGPGVELDHFLDAQHLVDHLWKLAESGKILEQSSWAA